MSIIIDSKACVGCESCAAVCPVGAISMVQGRAVLNNEKCLSCGACVSECITDAISMTRNAAENRK